MKTQQPRDRRDPAGQPSPRKIDWIKQRFVAEGLEVALSGVSSQRCYEHKIDSEVEAHPDRCGCWPIVQWSWNWWRHSRTRRCGGH